ncbi:FGGY-family carbohydrate kinase [Nesterenkonia sp. DZ6]|uniref:FGGY-family carbohydrate kinase n=1 Tax=Nesterenkonia sp. DZ6 TaxID=2901229 RepID=UPI001F4D2129|nr:FGGY-family carbohydrate kinase [Nesterenkonia sp. DZ6]MCH8559230.1 ATPase [Nesterenkonia sp. DZ6]
MNDERIRQERTTLGIEFGSTRIKACLVGESGQTLATGSSSWESELLDGVWTYSLEAVREGLAAAYADLAAQVVKVHGIHLRVVGAIGVSAMMHGYLALDSAGELLAPFRTWRNTTTTQAAARLTEELRQNIPLRWSVAHHYQAILDAEPHVPRVHTLTTLAGYVHHLLTGTHVLGIGDASGMFPIDPDTADYDAEMLDRFDQLTAGPDSGRPLSQLLPPVASAGMQAGFLTPEGAQLLDATGALEPGIMFCPPEGDAGTGMVASNAVRARTGNVSVGTSIFAMLVLEDSLRSTRGEIDIVATPDAKLVAMVHCNNGASELGAWAGVFGEFLTRLGYTPDADEVFQAMLSGALEAEASQNGLLAYNLLAAEPIIGVTQGRPMIVRTPGTPLSLAGFARAQLLGVFAALSVGMAVLAEEGVTVDRFFAHGGLLRTGGVAQRALAAALGTPVSVMKDASEGGAWGIAVLARYARAVATGSAASRGLPDWLDEEAFAGSEAETVEPSEVEIADYAEFLGRWLTGLPVELAAGEILEERK